MSEEKENKTSANRRPNYRAGRLIRNGANLLIWLSLRVAIQAAVILLLARSMRAPDYGQLVAILATASLIMPLTGLGLSHIVLRNGSKNPLKLAAYLNKAITWWWITLPPSLVLAVIAAHFLLATNLPILTVCITLAAEIISTTLTDLYARAQQAAQNTNRYGLVNSGLPLVRLMALGMLFLNVNNPDITTVLLTYATSSLAYAILIHFMLSPYRAASIQTHEMPANSGIAFSANTLTQRLQTELNKPLLAHQELSVAGSYNLAQRAIDVACLPLIALQESLWPHLYSKKDPLHRFKRTGTALIVISLLISAGIWLTAPLISQMFGASHTPTTEILRALAWLPIFQTTRALLNFPLIHYGHTAAIGWSGALAATVTVFTLTLTITTMGASGAVLATYAGECAALILLAIAIRKISK